MLIRALVVTAALVGCKGSAKDTKDTKGSAGSGSAVAAQPSAAAKPSTHATPETKLARYQECLAAANTGNNDAIASCYADEAVREQVNSVPELVAHGPDRIAEMVTGQKAAFPDLAVKPRIVVVSGNTIAAIVHVAGSNSAAAGGMKATNKKLGVFQAELATLGDDGKLTRDSFYVDQPTIFHQLGLLANESSPGALAAPAGEPELLISKNDEREKANKAIVQKNVDALSAKDPTVIEAASADDIKFTYHGEKQKIESKAGYMKWINDTMKSTKESAITISGIWAAGDVVVIANEFTGTPSDEVGAAEGKTIKNNVMQFFRVVDGKIKEHQIFANRLNTAVQLGFVDPDQLMQTLSAAAK